MPDKSLSGICGYLTFCKIYAKKILSKRGLLIITFLGFCFTNRRGKILLKE